MPQAAAHPPPHPTGAPRDSAHCPGLSLLHKPDGMEGHSENFLGSGCLHMNFSFLTRGPCIASDILGSETSNFMERICWGAWEERSKADTYL